jgi:UDP-N-acetylmuramyl tripeptide synthase
MYLLCIWIGKFAQSASRLTGKNGTALPGYIIERIYKSFVAKAMRRLPEGVVVVTGTNGKTTTTKLITETLEGMGKQVLTNRSGSNFVRGVISQVVADSDWRGRLHKNVAILEQDEAYAVHFVRAVRPRGVLILNIMRDQMDRFGEIDKTADLLGKVTSAAESFVVLNAHDPRVSVLPSSEGVMRHYFGVAPELRSLFPNDDDWHGAFEDKKVRDEPSALVNLLSVDDNLARYEIDGQMAEGKLSVSGLHNFNNAGAALAVCRVLLPEAEVSELFTAMSHVAPAFGRGETVVIGSKRVRLQLVKNPAGFTQSLKIMNTQNFDQVMVAINDAYADGRDMSWLWDVTYDVLKGYDGRLSTSGVRAYDMAVRLRYDECKVGAIEQDLNKALSEFIGRLPENGDGMIFCTYTAMLALRKQLERAGHVEVVR